MGAVSMLESMGEQIREVAQGRRIPCATYRLQFNSSFTFEDARQIVDYLDELGISDCYASPLLRSCSGSSHGYDICDHHHLNPAMGGEPAFEAFSAALRQRQMGLVLDIVPNHMGIGEPANAWWMDVLENGPSSVYASYFDIDWKPVKRELENKVLLPILEDQYGKVLESGKLRLAYEDGAFFLYYYETKLPIAPHAYSLILGARLEALSRQLGEEDALFQELQSILTAISYLPPRDQSAPEKVAERNREKEVIKRRIGALCAVSPEIRAAIDETVATLNGQVGCPRSFDALDELLTDQAYRPAFWRVATEEINYRRFFDINKLAAIRIELPEVFQASHELIFRLLTEGKATGLRVDHPDGLWNPEKYFQRLQERYLFHLLQNRLGEAAPPDQIERETCAWVEERLAEHPEAAEAWPLYVVAEKILSEEEPLPQNWPVYGTTGYDFTNQVNGLFVDSEHRKDFDKIYSQFIGYSTNFRDLINSSKKMIMAASLASEINALGYELERLAERNRLYRDFTLGSLTSAIREVIACLPIYRTYIVDSTHKVEPRDQKYVEKAVAEARRRNPRMARAIFDFLRDTLLLRNIQDFGEEDRKKLFGFIMKFQQVTSPVMAKGMEDTAFYIYNRLVSLNEVGGSPTQFGISVENFHRQNLERRRHWPHSMLATATHDTKRGEDVRARIDVLSEMPGEWRTALGRWSRLNGRKKAILDGEPAPSRNDEYLLYQTLVGAWPFGPLEKEAGEALVSFRARMIEYMQKATKEAKVHTSWVNPNEAYDEAIRDFVSRLLPDRPDRFLTDLDAFARHVALFGQFNSLAQTLIKLTAPGMPDIYQGTELWDLNLVDPDNRRPVDYPLRRGMLADLRERIEEAGEELAPLARELLQSSADGRIKLYLTSRTLHFRRAHERLFSQGDYLALETAGAAREHLCAFARRRGDEEALVVTPRLVFKLTGGAERPPLGEEVWGDTRLILSAEQAGAGYRNLLTGETLAARAEDGAASLALAKILSAFPVALLERIRA